MNVYNNTSTDEFIDWLRETAIKNKMPPIVIDAIDKLRELKELDEENDQLRAELASLSRLLERALYRLKVSRDSDTDDDLVEDIEKEL
jgi:hypothetical protein